MSKTQSDTQASDKTTGIDKGVQETVSILQQVSGETIEAAEAESGDNVQTGASASEGDFNPSEYTHEDDGANLPVTETPNVTTLKTGAPDLEAPHGRDANGKPLAPYGYSRKGRVKILPGKPRDDGSDPYYLTGEKPKTAASAGVTSDEDALKELISKPKPEGTPAPAEAVPTPEPAKKTSEELMKKYTVFISGSMLLVALDFVAGNVIVKVYELYSEYILGKRQTVADKKELKLTEEEKKDMVELADAVAKEILAGLSPLQQFALYMAVLYGTKITYAAKVERPEKVKRVKKQPGK